MRRLKIFLGSILFSLVLPATSFSFLCIVMTPRLVVSPSALDFGRVIVNTAATQSFTVTYRSGRVIIDGLCTCNCSNPASSSVSISSSSPAFTISPATFQLSDGGSRSVQVTFRPSSEEAASGSLTLNPSAPGAPDQTVELTGMGYQPQPDISLNTSSFAFGSVRVGSSDDRALIISNMGDAALTGSLSVSGPFSLSAGSFSILPGGSQTVTVSFNPVESGLVNGLVTVSSNDPDEGNLGVSLTGTGFRPAVLSLNRSNIDFGTVTVGSAGAQTVVITNSGDETLTGTLSTGGVFAVSPGSFSLGAGGSADFTVRFTPNAGGSFSGTVTVASNAGNASVSLAGVGYQPQPNINVSAGSLSFGNVPVNSPSSQMLLISNRGDAPLTGSLSVSSGFGLSSNSLSIGPGGSQSFTVTFSPTVRGVVEGGVTIASNDPDAGNLLINLSGTGVAPYLQITPAGLGFGSVPVGATETATLTLANLDRDFGAVLSLPSFQISGDSFSFSGPAVNSLAPGESTTVQVSFTPGSTGPKTGRLNFISNDPWTPGTIGLTGTGVAPAIDPSTLSLSWGDIHLGTSGRSVLSLANRGTSTLAVTGISTPHPSVSVSPSSASIAPGRSQDFSVLFAPTGETTLSGSLVVRSNDLQLPGLEIALSGRGVSPRIISTDSLDFGNVLLNPYNLSAEFTDLDLLISNEGREILSIPEIRSSLPDFIPLTTTLSIAPASQASIRVRYRPGEVGPRNGTLWISSNDYFLPTRSVNLTGTGVSYLDLTVSGLEVTQAIQTPQNVIPLVAGKSTVVRAFPEMSLWGGRGAAETIRNVDGILSLYRNGVFVTSVSSLNGPIDVLSAPDRNNADQSLNFMVPGPLTDCAACGDSVDMTFTVLINPVSGGRAPRAAESNYNNNTATTLLPFSRRYRPLVASIPVSYTIGQSPACQGLPDPSFLSQGTAFMKKIYPIAGLIHQIRPPISFNCDVNVTDLTCAGRTPLSRLFQSIFIASHLGGATPDLAYGWFRCNPYAGNGAAIRNSKVAFGNTEPARYQRTFAHELGHNLGFGHNRFVIGQTGFDVEANLLKTPGLFDIMVAGLLTDQAWIRPDTYRTLYDAFDPANPFTTRFHDYSYYARPDEEQPVFLVSGGVDADGSSFLNEVYETTGPWDAPEIELDETPDRIVLLDVADRVLGEYPILIEEAEHDDDGEIPGRSFSVIVPGLPGTKKIRLVSNGGVVSEIVRSDHPPEISILAPAEGETVNDRLRGVWSASDRDGDRLSYSVLYRSDPGREFAALAVNFYETSFAYPASLLSGSDHGVLRVIATDGFNTATVDSNPFRVGKKPPGIFILAPRDGETFFDGVLISLEADASDPEEGGLPPASVHWESSLAGDLGNGNPLDVVLPAGRQTLTATVTDSDGNRAAAAVEVIVADGAHVPRASAGEGQAVDEGDIVTLDASASSDPDEDDVLNFEWFQIDGPEVELADRFSVAPAFIAPAVDSNSLLRFRLNVTDRAGNLATDFVDITVLNAFDPSQKLLPGPEGGVSGPPVPEGSPPRSPEPATGEGSAPEPGADRGSFQFKGVGGCSLTGSDL